MPIPATISGIVADANGPIANAIVQVKGTPNQTTTDSKGSFTLKGSGGTKLLTLTAWYEGYFVGFTDLNPKQPAWQDGKPVSITLRPLYTTDNNLYGWFTFNGINGSKSCAICHREHPEWQADAHSQTAKISVSRRSIWEQTSRGKPARIRKINHDGTILPPDPSLPYYGPGYKLDFPDRTGNCATCHTPVASTIPNQQNCAWLGCHKNITVERSTRVIDTNVFPVSLTGNAAEGITCEFCHKVGAVILNPKTGLPHAAMPGILSMKLFRPSGSRVTLLWPSGRCQPQR